MSQETKEQEAKEQPNAYIIPAPLAIGILKYLDSKPHGEVKNLVARLQQARPITIKQAADEVQEKSDSAK